MKYIKLFEDYNNSSDIEDVLLSFVDDGICTVQGNQYFNVVRLSHKHTDKMTDVIDRLNRFNIKYELIDNSINSIFWFSDEIKNKFVESLVGSRVIIKYQNDRIMWGKNNEFVACEDRAVGQFRIRRSIWRVFEDEYGMGYGNTKVFMTYMVSEYFPTIPKHFFITSDGGSPTYDEQYI